MDRADKRRLAGLPAARSSGGRIWSRFAKSVVDHYGGLCHLCLATTEVPGKPITSSR